jgi:hypothetical protein
MGATSGGGKPAERENLDAGTVCCTGRNEERVPEDSQGAEAD